MCSVVTFRCSVIVFRSSVVFGGKKTHRDNTVRDDILEKIRQYIITGNLCFKTNVVDCSIVLLVLHQASSRFVYSRI